ncbi:zinc finger protein 227-like [Galendromus occidentalis]|uniref:Zinc finger protein 227-like n=1 Tax=Galendromus occidentalis TaxID=34638 RepID=A0AAJ6QSN7_9ACAR|nr:zinc finger protein 227-like [Galendromus occidentalis]
MSSSSTMPTGPRSALDAFIFYLESFKPAKNNVQLFRKQNVLCEVRNPSSQVDLLVRALENEMPTNVQALYGGIPGPKDAAKERSGTRTPTETTDELEESNEVIEDGDGCPNDADDCPNDADDEHSDPSYAPHRRARLRSSRKTSSVDELSRPKKKRGSGARPFRCEICNSGFGHESTLRNHRRIHTGEKPHQCPVCCKGFSQIGNMKRHMAQHTNLALSCQHCSVVFASKSLLDAHMRSCRSGDRFRSSSSTSSSSRPPRATVLQQQQDVEQKQQKKQVQHTNAYPSGIQTSWPSQKPGKDPRLWTMYPCPHCDKVLTWQYDYRNHVEGHRRLSCDICGKADFKNSAALSSHARSAH